ncbi:MAG: cytochrome c3 family protein [Thermoguttaceae bacterium]
MKKLFSLLTSALLLVWAVVPGSAEDKSADKKPAAAAVPAEKTGVEDAKSPSSAPVSAPAAEGAAKNSKPAEAKSTETKPAEAKPAGSKTPAAAIVIKSIPDTDNTCIQCHTSPDTWDPKDQAQYKFHIPLEAMKNDVHWQKGVRCQDCHGGDATVLDVKAHQANDDFRAIKSPADIPDFCGRCHSNIEYMRHFSPSPRTDQLAEYWTSGHGKRLKATGDPKVATCISCHDQPHGNAVDLAPHGIRPVNEPASPVYHTKVAQTCSKCHSDPKTMAGYVYKGQPLPCDEYAKWRKSVHGKALLDKGDLRAPTCNNCHGNHGAAPPQTDSVANACGACHGKIAKLFEATKMRHKFESEGLPGCATCHSNHEIREPSDDFLGMQNGTFCVRCHEQGNQKHGATLAGAKAAELIHADLQKLKTGIQKADETLSRAEEKGMEVSEPKFNLHKAFDSLTNARTQIHSFQVDVVQKALADGEKVVADVQGKADRALQEYQYRRYWLAISLIPIFIVIGLLLLYIRALPIPAQPADSEGEGTTGK